MQTSQNSAENPSESFTPMNDQIRKMGYSAENLVENVEGLTYYQWAKSTLSEMFFREFSGSVAGELLEDEKANLLSLHSGLQAVLDGIHKEYREGRKREICAAFDTIGEPKKAA